MVGVLTRVLGKSGRGREQTPAQDNGNNSSSEQPNPIITLYGKIPPDLTNFSYIVGSGDLYNAGFRPMDLILLTLRQNGTSAEVPAYITGILPMESYTGAPTQTVPPSEMDDMPCELSDLLRKDVIRQSLQIRVLGGR